MTQRQAQVWIAHARGDTLAEIARSLGISAAVAHRHLARAQERARQSWLAAYASRYAPERRKREPRGTEVDRGGSADAAPGTRRQDPAAAAELRR